MKIGISILVAFAIISLAFISFVIFSDLENKQYDIKEFIKLEEK